MDSDASRERTARWIQSQFSSGRQPQSHLSLPKSHLQRQHSLAHSNQTDSSSRTAISQPRRLNNASVTSPHTAKPRTGAYDAQTHRPTIRPYIPTAVYQKPDLPAFVQGPPGSGFPKTMPVSPLSATVIKPPSPPLNIPIPLNPKKSRPAVHKRRPSLSGTSFDPPDRHLDHQMYKDIHNQDRVPRRRANSESRYQ